VAALTEQLTGAGASMSNSPHGGSGAVARTACNVLMKAVTIAPGFCGRVVWMDHHWFARICSIRPVL